MASDENEAPMPDDSTPGAIAGLVESTVAAIANGVPRVPTGWPVLDGALRDSAEDKGGFVLPSLVVMGAEPKAGKSTWAQIVAERHAEAGGISYYVDLENGPARFMRRLLCRRAKVGPGELRAGLKDGKHEDWKEAQKAVRELGTRFFLEPTPRALSRDTFPERVAAYKRRAEAGKPLLVVVDSLNKLPMENLSERRAEIDGWLRVLEDVRDSGVIVLAISELHRGKDGYANPGDASFKESGGIEYSGDLLLTLAVDKPRDDSGKLPFVPEPGEGVDDGSPATLEIRFNRDGRTGRVADYRSLHPFYGMSETGPAPRLPPKGRR